MGAIFSMSKDYNISFCVPLKAARTFHIKEVIIISQLAVSFQFLLKFENLFIPPLTEDHYPSKALFQSVSGCPADIKKNCCGSNISDLQFCTEKL